METTILYNLKHCNIKGRRLQSNASRSLCPIVAEFKSKFPLGEVKKQDLTSLEHVATFGVFNLIYISI